MFYEKFFVRRHIAVLMRYLRTFASYQEALQKLNKTSSNLFVKFINMMLNDSHYLLDEVLTKLPEIKEIEQAMENREQWSQLDETTRRDKEEALQQHSRLISTYCVLAAETLLLFDFLSGSVIEPFLDPQLIDRISQMLNYFLYHLAGPRSLNLKVKDPKRFHFDPKLLLTEIAQIYLHFHKEEIFIKEVVKDVRSFKIEVFKQAIIFMKREQLLDENKITAFENFITKVTEESLKTIEEEEDLEDVPDEFIDPLTSILMQDPVILPASGQTVDKSTITRHLLSYTTDPFTRQPLSIDQVQPNVDMKNKIEEFKNNRKRKSDH